MRHAAAILFLPLLAACATPAQQCRITATSELRQLDRMIQETQVGIAQGYRLVQIPDPFRVGLFTCIAPSDAFGFCVDDDYSPTYRREALNIPAERAKLASLLAQRQQAEARARSALAACPAD